MCVFALGVGDGYWHEQVLTSQGALERHRPIVDCQSTDKHA